MAEVVGDIPYASTCSTDGNATCSTSSYCRCATTYTGQHICTQQMNCGEQQCGPNGECAKDGSTCVTDDRCPGINLCYSIVIFSPELCPPLTAGGDSNMK
jgi:hypothetical protein